MKVFLPFPAISIQANVFAVLAISVFMYDAFSSSYRSFITKTSNPTAIIMSGVKAMFIGGWLLVINALGKQSMIAWVLVFLPFLAAFIAR